MTECDYMPPPPEKDWELENLTGGINSASHATHGVGPGEVR